MLGWAGPNSGRSTAHAPVPLGTILEDATFEPGAPLADELLADGDPFAFTARTARKTVGYTYTGADRTVVIDARERTKRGTHERRGAPDLFLSQARPAGKAT